MKVIAVVLMVAVAAVCAFPAEELSANENLNTFVAVEAEPIEVESVQYLNGLVRDKRQYGGDYEKSLL